MNEKVSVHEVGVLSGNPSTKLAHGTVHLSSDDTPTRTLCVLNIPDYVGIDELWHFFTSAPDSGPCSAFTLPQLSPEMASGIVAVKLLRNTSTPDKYAALVLFGTKEKAASFLRAHNGKHFVSLGSPNACAIFYADGISIDEEIDCFGPEITLSELFAPSHNKGGAEDEETEGKGGNIASDSSCSFCTDDIQIGGSYPVLITLCGHCFHAGCIAKWKNGWCPLCRCPLQPPMGNNSGDDDDSEKKEVTSCYTCGCSDLDNLWECLVCANVGCDKCVGSHAYAHYVQEGHVFAFNVASKRVWDFTRNVYVNRIVLNKADGKPVEVDSKDEKIGNFEAYYLQLMDIQKGAFDSEVRDLIQRHKREIEVLKDNVSRLEARLKEVKAQTAAVRKKSAELKAKNERLTKENVAADKVIASYSKMAESLSSNERDRNAVVRQMQENVPLWKKKFDDLERKYRAERDKLQAEISRLQKENEKLMSRFK